MKFKKALIVLCLFIAIFQAKAQIIENPKIESQRNNNIGIIKIENTNYNTIIHFVYRASEEYENGGWFNVNPSIYIKSSSGYTKYKLVKADGVPLAPEKKQCDFAGQILTFRLIFQKVDNYIDKIDIIEDDTENCFNFYGVSLNTSNESNTKTANSEDNETEKQFRLDYNYVAVYDPLKESWGDWKEGKNTFVFNINDNYDFKLFQANGEYAIFRKVSDVTKDSTKDGKKYQAIAALDKVGDECVLQLFDFGDAKLVYKNGVMVQFTNSLSE